MPTASNALIKYEAGQTPVAMAALTDSGDQTTFTGASSPWSQRSGYAPDVRPDGLITGGAITPAASGTSDKVDVAAGTAYIGGALVSWSAATDVTVTRGLTTDTHSITSITVTAAGAVAAVAGTDGTAFSETRAANGGPPLIPVTSIEIGQVRTSSVTAAAIAAGEIYQVPGTHAEWVSMPKMDDPDCFSGSVTFNSPLAKIHTGNLPKRVYASYATPIFANVPAASEFKAPRNSVSASSEQHYGGTQGFSKTDLQSGGFKALLKDGVSDHIVTLREQHLWFKFFPDCASTRGLMCEGVMGVDVEYPVTGPIKGTFTISATRPYREIT